MDACRHPFVMKLICPVLLPERSDGAAVLTPSALIFQRLSRDPSHIYIRDERIYPITMFLLFQEKNKNAEIKYISAF